MFSDIIAETFDHPPFEVVDLTNKNSYIHELQNVIHGEPENEGPEDEEPEDEETEEDETEEPVQEPVEPQPKRLKVEYETLQVKATPLYFSLMEIGEVMQLLAVYYRVSNNFYFIFKKNNKTFSIFFI